MDALVWLRKQLETGDNDLLREMVRSFAEGLMGAEADLVCGAPYRVVSPDRTNRRNGYRTRRWDTRVGTIDLRIPKLRESSYFPEWLLDARTRSERAFTQVALLAVLVGHKKGGRRAHAGVTGPDRGGRAGRRAPGTGHDDPHL